MSALPFDSTLAFFVGKHRLGGPGVDDLRLVVPPVLLKILVRKLGHIVSGLLFLIIFCPSTNFRFSVQRRAGSVHQIVTFHFSFLLVVD